MNGREKPGEVVKRSPWKNRIIGSDIVDPKTLQPNELNWRKHPKPQADALNGALDSIGWIQDIIVNKQTGRMIDGHLRVELALKNNETEVPVKYVDLTPEEEEQALLTLDPIGAMAEADKNLLEALLNQVQTDDERIRGLLDSIRQDYKIKKEVQEDDYEPPAEIETDIQRGDIYQLGKHRVMCGDSTSESDSYQLINGNKIDLCLTDPPYGIDWNGDYTRFSKGGVVQSSTTYEPIYGDEIQFNPDFLLHYPLIVLWGANFYAEHLPVGSWLVWDKRSSDNTSFLADAELAWHNIGKGAYIFSVNQQSEKSKTRDIRHPTKKPVGLFSWCITRIKDDISHVYDPFLGSGTTLIACEQLGRICYGMEISPQYCEVICQRWEKLTGKHREKVSGVSA